METVARTELAEKEREIHRRASQLFRRKGINWITFFREILGVGGIAREMYPSTEAMAEFEKTEAYAQIQQMLAKLRNEATLPPDQSEPTRVITVRLPKSLHDLLTEEAHEYRTSVNKLCISKLIQFIDNQRVPNHR